VLAGLRRVQHIPVLYRRLLQSFVQAQAGAPALIRAAVQQGHGLLAERTAHTLKGVAGSIGAETVAATAEQLEMAIHLGLATDRIAHETDATEAALAPLLSALQMYLDTSHVVAKARPEPAGEDLPQLCEKLRALLQQDDAAAADCLQEFEPAFRRAMGSRFEALKKAVQAFEFEAALGLLRSLTGAPD
jgi:two-component system sensor histidine kinase/response regulator